jgi:hypothetical protein
MGLRSLVIWLLLLPHFHAQQLTTEQERQLQQWQQFQQHQAQAPQDVSPWTTSYFDLGQNIRLDQIDGHFRATDGSVTELQKENMQLARELSDVEARSSVWFGIIGAATVGALGLALNNFLKIKDKP